MDRDREKHTKKKITVLALGAMLFALCVCAQAQQPAKKIPRVGILSLTPATVQKDRVEAFREALRKLGYIDGLIVFPWIRPCVPAYE